LIGRQGRWEYKAASQDAANVKKDPGEVTAFRREMPASKWYGRGGVKKTLMRFVTVSDRLFQEP